MNWILVPRANRAAIVGGVVAAAPFTPSSLSGLSLWLTASNYNASTGTWTDISGHSNNFTNGGASKPTLNASAQNGKPAVKFNGAQFLSGSFGWSDNYFTAFIVGRQTTLVDYPAWIAESSGVTTGYAGLIDGTVSAGSFHGIGQFGLANQDSGLASTVNVFDISTWSSVGTANAHQIDTVGTNAGLIEIIIKQNGALGTLPGVGLAGFPMASPGTSIIGAAENGTSDFLTGEIAEVIFYNRYLSAWEIAQVNTYLGAAGMYAITVTNPALHTADAFTGWTVHATPVLTVGAGGSWESNALTGPSVVLDSGTYYVTYVGADASLVNKIGIASGTSPTSLTKYVSNPILGPSASAWDKAYVSGDQLFKDPVGGQWYLLYFGGASAGFEQPPASIGIAGPSSSPFGPWTNAASPVLVPGTSGAWDDKILYRPFLRYDAGTYYLYYNAAKVSDGLERIGYATSSAVLGPYTKSGSNPVIQPIAFTSNAQRVGDACIIKPDGTANYIMFHFGAAPSNIGEVHMATSTDLNTWTFYVNNSQMLYMRNTGLPNAIRMSVVPTKNGSNYEAFCDDGTSIYYMTLPSGF